MQCLIQRTLTHNTQLSCFIGPLTSDGCANLTDFACHCKKGDTLLAQVQPCVQKGCEAADQAKAIAAVESTCQAAGVPITIPDTGAPAQSSAPAASASPSAAPAPSSAASAASSVASAASSVISSIVASGTPVPMPTPISTGTPSMTPSGSPSASGAPTSSVSQFTGAAAQATQAVGIIGAAALAMLAL